MRRLARFGVYVCRLVIALGAIQLPICLQPLIASFETVDRKLLDASAVLAQAACAPFAASFCPYPCQES